MHPEQIKAAIRMTGTTPAVLAEELGLSRSMLSAVIAGRGKSARVQERIAQVTGLSVDTLWPGSAVPGAVLRRASPAKEPQTPERRVQDRRMQDRRVQDRTAGRAA